MGLTINLEAPVKQFLTLVIGFLLAFTAKAGDAPRSHVLIVGIEEYPFAPELPHLQNAQTECQELATTLGTSEAMLGNVVSLCGAEATGPNIIKAFTESLTQVQTGENLVLVLRAHGAVDSGAPGLMASDMFDPELLAPTSSLIDISILRDFIANRVPAETKLFVYLDGSVKSQNPLVYRDFPLREIGCSDFSEYPNLSCFESDPGPDKPTMAKSMSECLGLVSQDGPVAFGQFNICVNRELAFLYGTSIPDASVELAHKNKKPSSRKLRFAGSTLLATSGALAVSGAITYGLASRMKHNVLSTAPETIYPNEPAYNDARSRYSHLRSTTYGLFTASVVLAGSGTALSVTPHGASIDFKW
ncbi:hypothetical protein COY25_04570 [Candidatus Uhrbacteria bacterium CG_4_10_14_0_2_um_filter_41_7]|uniref:Uncharacterized protein n=1 Tax=Candidatus Uhrbacteria bacterium CG_4_9_14_3_um_filter_41_35 TaxID=1975034 RepID=A0A2M7XH15_9BACT|nr:MAG: hypothetical protein COY25_04570 [Candidatus Uhrbacteria bacterium CG_4_10_14_0_2_um_filter_41_7]PJA47026.1 MAG: hypothetical protein CO173_00425 [Candidatus Uhrbacteria bacterium CG_4_9_14_3_um_filter_41_35]